MIVQCDQCKAKFQLDDSKVTEYGVKVRCSKCKNIFTVKKEPVTDETAAGTPKAVDKLGTGAEFASTASSSLQGSPSGGADKDTSISFESFGDFGDASGSETDMTTPGPATEGEENAAAGGGDFPDFDAFGTDKEKSGEEDISWGDLGGGGEALAGGFGEARGFSPESDKVQEDAFDADMSFGFEADSGGLGLDAGGEDVSDQDFGFSEDQPDSSFGFDENISESSPPSGEEFGSTAYGEFDMGESGDSGMNLDIEETSNSSAAVPAGLAESAVDEAFDEGPEDIPAAPKIRREIMVPSKRQRKKSSVMPLLLLLLLLIAGGAYYVVITGTKLTIGGYDVNKIVEQIVEEIKVKSGLVEAESIELKNLKGYYVENVKYGGFIFVVEGTYLNGFKSPRSFIRLRGNLYDDKGKLLMKQDAYGGNKFAKDDLINLSKENIIREMDYKLGKNLTNSGVQPGASVPFMIVFYNVPENLAEFNVEILSSESAT